MVRLRNINDIKNTKSLLGKRRDSKITIVEDDNSITHKIIASKSDIDLENMIDSVEIFGAREKYYNDFDLQTRTIRSQIRVEKICSDIYKKIIEDESEGSLSLQDDKHFNFLIPRLTQKLPFGFVKLDSSQSWLLYWIVNSLVLIHTEIDEDIKVKIAEKVLSLVDDVEGGIAGGRMQIGHAASTYSSLVAFSFCNDENSWSRLDRNAVYSWMLHDLKKEDGSFSMHKNGESDTRAVYCALCIASMLNIISEELIEGTVDWLSKCQTYEGGFGGDIGNEAHGGYTFCAVASLCILGDPKVMLTKHCNLDRLIEWCAARQMDIEGGFSGRTNKLVDGCYSHWVGGIFHFLEAATGVESLFSREDLSKYILGCCQYETGGLIDKPGKTPDLYHTNYVLAGLSHLQHIYEFDYNKQMESDGLDSSAYCYVPKRVDDTSGISDKKDENIEDETVAAVNPIFGSAGASVEKMKNFYRNLDH